MLGLDGLDYTPEPWTPVDSLAWLKAMAWDLRGNMDDEIDRALASRRPHAPSRSPSSTRATPTTRHAPIVDQGAVVDGVFEQDATRPGTRLPRRAGVPAGARGAARPATDGSSTPMPDAAGRRRRASARNAWVVAGDHTATGKPLLANDPHLGAVDARASGTRWACTARTVDADCPFDVTGFTFSGLPGRGDRPQPRHRLGVHQPRTRTSPTSTWRRSAATTYLYDGRQRAADRRATR